jgi:hypothetical protein
MNLELTNHRHSLFSKGDLKTSLQDDILGILPAICEKMEQLAIVGEVKYLFHRTLYIVYHILVHQKHN